MIGFFGRNQRCCFFLSRKKRNLIYLLFLYFRNERICYCDGREEALSQHKKKKKHTHDVGPIYIRRRRTKWFHFFAMLFFPLLLLLFLLNHWTAHSFDSALCRQMHFVPMHLLHPIVYCTNREANFYIIIRKPKTEPIHVTFRYDIVFYYKM